jgi:hypothetical protein
LSIHPSFFFSIRFDFPLGHTQGLCAQIAITGGHFLVELPVQIWASIFSGSGFIKDL